MVKGKNIYILGGSGTIGTAVSKFLISNGANVKNLDINDNHTAQYINFDCTELNNSASKLKNIFLEFGSPHVFINCSYPRTDDWASNSFSDCTLESLKINIEFHLLSYVWISKIFADFMKENSIAGSIIMTSSVYGVVPQRDNLYEGTNLNENIIYPSIKAGINHHCKQMASYYGSDGIRVNSLSPGGLKGEIAGKNQKQDKKFIKNYEEMTALKRMCSPEDLVGAYLFLSSDSSSYITGQNLVIDGGFHLA